MATVLDLVTDSLLEIGVLAAGEVPAADEAESARRALNRMVNAWKAERVYIYFNTRTEFTMSSNVGTYTVGPGGDADVIRPNEIDAVNILDTVVTPNFERTLRVMTDQDYAELRIKTQTAYWPESAYYNLTYPLATLVFWPTPTSATLKGVIYAPEAVAEFTALNTIISLPPGYERLIVKNLAIELAPGHQAVVSPQLQQQAQEALAVVLRANTRKQDMRFDPGAAMTRRSYDIYSDLTRM